MTVTFDCWENGNPNVFEETTTGSPAEVTSVATLVEGVYSVSFQIESEVALPVGTNVGLAVDNTTGAFTPCPAVVMPDTPLAGFNSSGKYTMSFIQGFPPVWFRCEDTTPAIAPVFPEFVFEIAQDDPADRDFGLAMIEIYLLGGLSVDTSQLG